MKSEQHVFINEIGTALNNALFHASHSDQGLPDIVETMTIPGSSQTRSIRRRPGKQDIVLVSMFPQAWPSGALGFSRLALPCETTAYTVIIRSGDHYAVYFNGEFAYLLSGPNDRFYQDICDRTLAPVEQVDRYSRAAR